MCNQCGRYEMELLPELEEMIHESGTNFFPNKRKHFRSSENGNRQYEIKPPVNKPLQPQSIPNPKISATHGCLSSAFKLIPKHLEPELVSCIRTTILSERTQFLLNLSLQDDGPNWVKHIKPGVDIFKIFPTVNVSIELLHFIPISPRNSDLLKPLKAYMEAQSQYYSSIVAEISMYKSIENGLQIPFTGLFQKAGIDPAKLTLEEYKSYVILVYATYPDKVKNYLRNVEFTILDKFEFDKFNLPAFHLPVIGTIANDIFESWSGQKRVTSIILKGHTDESGSDAYNIELGKKRASAITQQLKLELDKIAPSDYKSSLQNIQFKIVSEGKKHPISNHHELNRRVEVTLQFTIIPKQKALQLDDVILRCIRLLNTRRMSTDPQVQRELCLLQKMQLAGTDDRFISGGQSVLDIQNRNRLPDPDAWNRVRFHLTSPNNFGDQVEDIRVLRSLDWLDDQIIQTKGTINQIIGTQQGATKKAIEQLTFWMHSQLKNNKSVFSCYSEVF